jgi:glucans biosynthesis protein
MKHAVRKDLILGLLTGLLLLTAGQASAEKAINFKILQKTAKALSAKPYELPPDTLPSALKDMGYDQWRDLRFKKSLWADDGGLFKVQFFHPGFIYHHPVTVHYIDSSGTHDYQFSSDLFDYGKTGFARYTKDITGFAGFRLHYPINTPEYDDEVVAFLGASYFRALPKGLFYGMSVRGLAVDTAVGSGEEFPFFKEFWIKKPGPKETKIVVYALLDSPSVVGAFAYEIFPGVETVMNVKSTLFIRQKIDKLGVAPLTSMYFYGENTKDLGKGDYRPEVHDSDGLLISTRTGEWIWRPLGNYEKLSINSFSVGTPRGFGLLQRDYNFDHYLDLEARYESRPSVWVEILTDWGPGHVELVQIPTNNEYNDNMVAFWVPEKVPQPGNILNYAYRLHWHSAKDSTVPLGYATDTRLIRQDKAYRFIVDFQGKALQALPSEQKLNADINVSKGYKIHNQQLFKNAVTGGWRLVFLVTIDEGNLINDILPETRPPCELLVAIKNKDKALTETWTYTLVP